MTDDPATRPNPDTPTPADAVARPEQPPMDDDAAEIEAENEAAKFGDFA